MTDLDLKLSCERHIADLKLRLAQVKEGSRLGGDALASAEFIDLVRGAPSRFFGLYGDIGANSSTACLIISTGTSSAAGSLSISLEAGGLPTTLPIS